MLNRRGGIECDFTVTRVEEELFSIVTGTAFGNHDLSWIRRHAPADGSVRCSDVTARWACFALWGPRAREILAPLTDDPLDFALHAHARARGRRRAGARPAGDVRRRARLGALLPDASTARGCGGRCGRPGAAHGLLAGGYRAIDSLRLEKGYRVWAADITADETPLRGGPRLLRARTAAFVGADGARRRLAPTGRRAPRRRLRCLVLEDPRSVALGNEPVRVGEEVVGRVTSGGYGYTVERSIAYAYLPAEVGAGRRRRGGHLRGVGAGEVAREPLFDPKGTRVRG